MAKLSYKISYYVLYACFAIAAVVFAAFFLIGFDRPSETLENNPNDPVCTDIVLALMGIMVLAGIALIVWSGVKSLRNSSKSGESVNGVPGGKVSIVSFGLLFVSLIVGYVCNLGAKEYVAADKTVTSAGMVNISDMFMWSIIILLLATIIATVVNMSGVFKKK